MLLKLMEQAKKFKKMVQNEDLMQRIVGVVMHMKDEEPKTETEHVQVFLAGLSTLEDRGVIAINRDYKEEKKKDKDCEEQKDKKDTDNDCEKCDKKDSCFIRVLKELHG